ncbi:MAG: carbonic anhydrase, partial [Solirubrobacterales bacterium]
MDARIDLDALLDLNLGDAHVIRNAGAIATTDVIRTLAASQRLLGTGEIIVVQHTDCGESVAGTSQSTSIPVSRATSALKTAGSIRWM